MRRPASPCQVQEQVEEGRAEHHHGANERVRDRGVSTRDGLFLLGLSRVGETHLVIMCKSLQVG